MIKLQKYKVSDDGWSTSVDGAPEWIAHPASDTGPRDGVDADMVANRDQIEYFGGVEDNDSSYSYDDWALVRFRGAFYLLSTSGCSCPSPTETWGVQMGPLTIAEIRARLEAGEYAGYTVPGKQMNDFMALLDDAEKS